MIRVWPRYRLLSPVKRGRCASPSSVTGVRAQVQAGEPDQGTQVGEARTLNLGVGEIQHVQARHPSQVNESGIGDPRTVELEAAASRGKRLRCARPASPTFVRSSVKCLQAREPLERCQAGVADLRTRKLQDSELGQALQVDQPRIGHRRAIQRQDLKTSQRFEVNQRGIRDRTTLKVQEPEPGQPPQ